MEGGGERGWGGYNSRKVIFSQSVSRNCVSRSFGSGCEQSSTICVVSVIIITAASDTVIDSWARTSSLADSPRLILLLCFSFLICCDLFLFFFHTK